MDKDDAFIEKIHKEMLSMQQLRIRFDLLKILFVIALLGLGSIKVEDIASLYNSLYLAPLVALFFDFMSAGPRFIIRQNGKFLREHSPSELEQIYEKYVSKNRDYFSKYGSFSFSILSFPAVVLLIKAVTGNYPSVAGYVVLAVLLVLHIILFILSNRRIKIFDLQVSDSPVVKNP